MKRCADCAYYKPSTVLAGWGKCERWQAGLEGRTSHAMFWASGVSTPNSVLPVIIVNADFGCIQFDPKVTS